MVFIDLEKAYDRMNREVIEHVVKNKSVYKRYIDVTKEKHEGAINNLGIIGRETDAFFNYNWLISGICFERISKCFIYR